MSDNGNIPLSPDGKLTAKMLSTKTDIHNRIEQGELAFRIRVEESRRQKSGRKPRAKGVKSTALPPPDIKQQKLPLNYEELLAQAELPYGALMQSLTRQEYADLTNTFQQILVLAKALEHVSKQIAWLQKFYIEEKPLPAPEACELLGISRPVLRRLIENGVLVPGVHYIDSTGEGSTVGRYWVYVVRTRDALRLLMLQKRGLLFKARKAARERLKRNPELAFNPDGSRRKRGRPPKALLEQVVREQLLKEKKRKAREEKRASKLSQLSQTKENEANIHKDYLLDKDCLDKSNGFDATDDSNLKEVDNLN